MADWSPVEKVAKNAEGKYQALVNGAWTPVDKVAKNAEGKYMALGFGAVTQAAPAKVTQAAPAKEDEPILPYVAGKFKEGLMSLPAIGPMAADIAAMPFRPLRRALGGNVPESMMPVTERYYKGLTSGVQDPLSKAIAIDPNAPVPKDEYGHPKLSAEILGNIALMGGSSTIPSGGTVLRSARPGVALAKELAGVVLSGEGMSGGKYLSHADMFGGPSPTGEAIGGIVGSMTGPMLVHKLIDVAAKGGSWVSSKGVTLTPGAKAKFQAEQLNQAKSAAAERLAPQLNTPAAREAIARSQEVARKVPGFGENLTLGRTTQSPAVKSMESHFASTDPAMLDAASQREIGLHSAISRYAEKRFPASDWSAQDEVKYIYADKLKNLDEGMKRLDRQERQIAQSLPRGDIEDIGRKQRDLIKSRLDLAREKKNALYNDVAATADREGVRVNMNDVVDLTKAHLGNEYRAFQNDPGVIGQILRRYSPEREAAEAVKITPTGGKIYMRGRPTAAESVVQPVKYGEFDSLYKKVNEESRNLSLAASAGNMDAAQKLPVVNSIRDLLRTKVDEMASPAYGEVGKKLMTANTYYRDTYSKLFKQGVGAEVLKNGKFGPSTENAKITESLIFKRGDPSGVREFLDIAGNDPRGMQLLENGIYDMLSKKVIRDGKVSKTALEGFLRDYKEPLAEVPNIRKSIESVQNATQSLKQNTARVIAAQSDLARSTLSSIAKEENPAKIVANAIKSPKYLDALLENTGAESRKDIARGVMEHALSTPDAIVFMKTNEAQLRKVLGKKQFESLRTIANARDIAESVKSPGYTQYQKEGEVLAKYGTSLKQVVSSGIAVSRGRSGKIQEATGLLSRFFGKMRNDEIDRLMKGAVYDPELAKEIANYVATGSKAVEKKLNDHLLTHGIRTIAATVREAGKPNDGEQQQ
jgi:hypothetical protein